MKKQLAGFLVCPATGEPLSVHATLEVDGEIVEGELASASGRRYQITGGVPRMLPTELIDQGQLETAGAFAVKWQRATDFGHEEKSRLFYIDWYLQRYKFKNIEALAHFLRSKSRILDAGTGNGGDTRLYADNSNALVFGVDISSAIDSAYEHLKAYPNVHLIQADLTRLPFPKHFFDFIACDQVLHHTRNTKDSFNALSSW